MAAFTRSSSFRPWKNLTLLLALGALPASLLAQGCQSEIIHEDGEDCCLMDPQCPADSFEVEVCATDACFSVEACCTEKLCEPDENCKAAPVCEIYETQVESCESAVDCRAVTVCGQTIHCLAESFCPEVPTCDPGDEETVGCPLDASCYPVVACGIEILCLDAAWPQHGCPASIPVEGDGCGEEHLVCDYPINGDCYESWGCQFVGEGTAWTFLGGGCPDG